ncbi:MAG: hypothetical protein ABIZ56_12925 [Chthoniobacteraceae bacterium]
MDDPRRQSRRRNIVLIAIFASGIAGLNVISAFQNWGRTWFCGFMIFTAITLAASAFFALLFRSSRKGLDTALAFLAFIIAQFFIIHWGVIPNAPQPPLASALHRESMESEDKSAAVIDTLEKTGLISETEAELVRKRRAADETLRFGDPHSIGATSKKAVP